MPSYVVRSVEARPFHDLICEAVELIEKRERIVAVVATTPTSVVLITEKKTGRPAKETRVTETAETR